MSIVFLQKYRLFLLSATRFRMLFGVPSATLSLAASNTSSSGSFENSSALDKRDNCTINDIFSVKRTVYTWVAIQAVNAKRIDLWLIQLLETASVANRVFWKPVFWELRLLQTVKTATCTSFHTSWPRSCMKSCFNCGTCNEI